MNREHSGIPNHEISHIPSHKYESSLEESSHIRLSDDSEVNANLSVESQNMDYLGNYVANNG